MTNRDLTFPIIEVDPRLLVFESCMKEMFLALHPHRAKSAQCPKLDQITRESMLEMYEVFGYARRVRAPDGRIRLEATRKYLREVLQAE